MIRGIASQAHKKIPDRVRAIPGGSDSGGITTSVHDPSFFPSGKLPGAVDATSSYIRGGMGERTPGSALSPRKESVARLIGTERNAWCARYSAGCRIRLTPGATS